MSDAYTDKSHLDVTWVSQYLYSGPLSNPDFFLSLIAGRIRQVVLYIKNFVLMALSLLHTYILLESLHRREGILARVSSYIDFPETSRGS